MISVGSEFKNNWDNSPGWVDREVVSCDGWYISKCENFGEITKDNLNKFSRLVLESQRCFEKSRNTILGVYTKVLKETEQTLDCHDYVLKTIRSNLFSYKANSREGRYLRNCFTDLLPFSEKDENIVSIEQKYKLKYFNDSISDFLFRIKSYTEDSIVSANNFYKDEFTIEEGLKKSLSMQVNSSFNFLNETTRIKLIDLIYDDCLERLKTDISNGGEKNRYCNCSKFVKAILNSYWDNIEKNLREFKEV